MIRPQSDTEAGCGASHMQSTLEVQPGAGRWGNSKHYSQPVCSKYFQAWMKGVSNPEEPWASGSVSAQHSTAVTKKAYQSGIHKEKKLRSLL